VIIGIEGGYQQHHHDGAAHLRSTMRVSRTCRASRASLRRRTHRTHSIDARTRAAYRRARSNMANMAKEKAVMIRAAEGVNGENKASEQQKKQ